MSYLSNFVVEAPIFPNKLSHKQLSYFDKEANISHDAPNTNYVKNYALKLLGFPIEEMQANFTTDRASVMLALEGNDNLEGAAHCLNTVGEDAWKNCEKKYPHYKVLKNTCKSTTTYVKKSKYESDSQFFIFFLHYVFSASKNCE